MDPHSNMDPHQEQTAQWISMGVELAVPGGVLKGNVQVYTGAMRLADLVPSAQELTQVVGGRAVAREAKEGRHVSCRAGCGACCRQLVPVSPPEAFHIADLLDRMDRGRAAAARERFAAVRSRLVAEDLIGAVFDVAALSEPPADLTRAVNQRYFRLGLPCPFLVEESCSIHPDRPVACRDYSVTTPADWCADPFHHPIQLVPMPLPLSVALARLTSELVGEKPALVPLSLVPFWVAEHEEWRSRTWPGLDLFRRFLQLAGPPAPPVGA